MKDSESKQDTKDWTVFGAVMGVAIAIAAIVWFTLPAGESVHTASNAPPTETTGMGAPPAPLPPANREQ